MEIEFPKFPFIWDYMDMYNIPEYKVNKLILEDYDDNIIFLLSKFKNFEIYESKQYFKSKENIKNLNIHTWYLSQLNIFETNEKNIKIITNSKIKYKSNVQCFIFDSNNIFDISIYETNSKFPNLPIVKQNKSIILSLIPKLYIHIHNINGILRFSPNNNNKIKLKENITTGIFYLVLDKIIIKFNILIE